MDDRNNIFLSYIDCYLSHATEMSSIERVVTSSLFTWRLPFSTVSSFWSVFHCNISFFCFLYRSPKQPSFARNRDEVPIRNQRALDTIVNIRSSYPCLRGETFFFIDSVPENFFFSVFSNGNSHLSTSFRR